MTKTDEPDGWRARLVSDWLFLILRFAVTRDDNDRVAVESLARQIDGIGGGRSDRTLGFFGRTSGDVCAAIVASDAQSRVVLRKHAQRIDNMRLKQCFCLAVSLDQGQQQPRPPSAMQRYADLWRGLPNRYASKGAETAPEG